MPSRRWIFRFVFLAAFLIAVAIVLWLADLSPGAVVGVMAAAWLIAAAIEWLTWREELGSRASSEGKLMLPPASRQDVELLVERVDLPPPPLPPLAAPAAPKPDGVPEQEPEPEYEPEPEFPPAPVREVEPPMPALAAVVEPEPAEPAPEPPQQALPEPLAPPRAPVFEPGGTGEWNLWELERLARLEGKRRPERAEEWAYLFVYLRRFANPDGTLPQEFDGLVRETFADLTESSGAA